MASASFAVSTPSPPSRIHTPGTPKHGYSDSWEPFSPRKSARISSQRANNRNRTPSPHAHSHSQSQSQSHPHSHSRSRKSSDSFSTPATSPRKKRVPAMDSVRRASGALTAEGTANAADLLGIGSNFQHKSTNPTASSSSSSAFASRVGGMLPTPAKTPRKQSDGTTEANVRSVARNLFVNESEIIPTPKKKKSKKYTGLTLDSFRAEAVDEPIEIFTDSRDRIPEKDATAENPFYGMPAKGTRQPEPTKRRSPRNHVSIPGEGRETIDEAVQREDGIVYVFRGKKFFRKFSDNHDDEFTGEPDIEVGEESVDAPEQSRRVTRSSIKPRLLFPSAAKGKEVERTPDEDEEEAATDIEDGVYEDTNAKHADIPVTPLDLEEQKLDTPKAPRFAPASPPTTVRATRVSSKPEAGKSPAKKATTTKNRSPFDGWRRSKRTAEPQGQKRDGDALPRPDEASKRQRI